MAALWARYFSPAKPGPVKNATYECGLGPKGTPGFNFKSDYYLYGILFLIFDVEAVFMFPFAVAFLGLPVGAVVAMLIFVLLLVEGLAWAWVKGVADPGNKMIDEGLRSELSKQGVFTTTLEEFTTGAAGIPSGRCNSASPVAPSR